MRGSVVKKGGRWYVKLELEPDPATGRRRQRWHSGFATKKEAERARVDLLSKLDRGEYVVPTQQTLGEFLTEWLTTLKRQVRPSTYDSYQRNMRLHVIDHIGRTKLTRVDAGTLNALYAELLTSGRRPSSRRGAGYSSAVIDRGRELRAQGLTLSRAAEQLRSELPEAAAITKHTLASLLRRIDAAAGTTRARDAGLSPRTVAYVHTILHRAFKDAVRWGCLARNPADAADPPRGARAAEVQAWDAATLRDFLGRSRDEEDGYYALWVLLATTGLRRGEALGLRWSDVDLETGRVRIVQTVIQIRGTVAVGEPKTDRGRRAITIDEGTVAALRAHRRLMNEQRLLVGADFNDRDLVFRLPSGEPMHPDAVSATFERQVRRYGLPRLTLHGLRHTWATLALESGIHPRVVQERLGHSTIAITLGIYSHVSPTLDSDAARTVAALMLPS
jgi:integrase